MPTEKRQILFVEMDKQSQELVTLALALAGYEIVIANNFAEGLRLAKQQEFELYILDNWLPDGSGIELCRRIREFNSQTPILFYSATGYKDETQDARIDDAQEYLLKPIEPKDVREAVARLLPKN